jgi:hypothetical protein
MPGIHTFLVHNFYDMLPIAFLTSVNLKSRLNQGGAEKKRRLPLLSAA